MASTGGSYADPPRCRMTRVTRDQLPWRHAWSADAGSDRRCRVSLRRPASPQTDTAVTVGGFRRGLPGGGAGVMLGALVPCTEGGRRVLMFGVLDYIAAEWPTIVRWALLAGFVYTLWKSVRYIPNNRAAVVERLWSFRGSLKTGFIALRGEAGFQAQVLRGG